MRLGCHVNRDLVPGAAGARPGIAEHIEAARRSAAAEGGLRMGVAQIFVGGAKNRVITLGQEEGQALRAYALQAGLQVVAHSSYTSPPWRGDPSAASYIRSELRACQAAGIAGLVVHLPRLPAESVLQYLPRLVEPEAPDVRVYLETPAVTPAETYYETPPKILALFRAIRQSLDPELVRFGLCVDTAHLWVSGVDLRSREAAQHWLAQLEDPASPERALGSGPPAPGGTPAIVFHLNDSQRPKGVGPDAHAPLAAGKIWGPLAGAPGESGIAAVVDFAARHGCWVVLERKPHAALAGDYHLLRGLAPAYRL